MANVLKNTGRGIAILCILEYGLEGRKQQVDENV